MSSPAAPTPPTATEPQRLGLQVEGHEGSIVDLDTVGADALVTVRFRSRSAPLLRIGDRRACTVYGGALKLPVEVEGYTVYRADDAEHRTYHFLFRDQAQRSLGMLINQRLSIRVRPSDDAPVRAWIDMPNGGTEVAVHDISSTGVSLLVGPDEEAALCHMRLLPLRIELPGQEKRLRFLGFVRNRRLLGSAIAYGVQFDQTASDGFERNQELVVKYVMKCHVAELQRRLAE